MTALTVHEHQGVVRGQTAQGCRADEGRPVADRLPSHVVGRHQRLHEVVHVGVGSPIDRFGVKHVYRNGGIRCGPRLTTKTGDHHLFNGLFGQRDGRHGEGSACRCNRNRKGQNLKFACLHTFNSQLGEPSSRPKPVRSYDHCGQPPRVWPASIPRTAPQWCCDPHMMQKLGHLWKKSEERGR